VNTSSVYSNTSVTPKTNLVNVIVVFDLPVVSFKLLQLSQIC